MLDGTRTPARPQREVHQAQGHASPGLYRRAGELGLVGGSLPEEYGVGGGNFGSFRGGAARDA